MARARAASSFEKVAPHVWRVAGFPDVFVEGQGCNRQVTVRGDSRLTRNKINRLLELSAWINFDPGAWGEEV